MRWLINYFRQVFCKHEFEFEESYYTKYMDGEISRQGTKLFTLCRKCGYHKTRWKF